MNHIHNTIWTAVTHITSKLHYTKLAFMRCNFIPIRVLTQGNYRKH